MSSINDIPVEIIARVVDNLSSACAARLMKVSRRSHAIVKRCFVNQHRRRVGPIYWLGGIRLTSTDSAANTTVQVRSCNSFKQPAPFVIDSDQAVDQLRPKLGLPVRVQDLYLDADNASSFCNWMEVIRQHRHAFELLHYVSLATSDDDFSALDDFLAVFSEVAKPLSVDFKFRRAFAGRLLSSEFVRCRANVTIKSANALTETDVEQLIELLHEDAVVYPKNTAPSMLRQITLTTSAVPVQMLRMRLVTKFLDADTPAEYKLHVKLGSDSGITTTTRLIYRNATTREVLYVQTRKESDQTELIVVRQQK